MNKNEIVEQARIGVMEVVFTKTDDSKRKMRFTLHPDALPMDDRGDQYIVEKTREENPNIVSVWDLDKNAFRSFRINSILHIEFLGTFEQLYPMKKM